MKIGVIGGGAAGFFGAITAAEACPDAQVVLLEAARDLLSKVRISGGGRCNVTHHCFDPALLVQHYPRGGKALRGAFTRFHPKDTVAWYARRGVCLKTEADGRMFPVTDTSQTIIDCLTTAAQRAGVTIQTRAVVTSVERKADGFDLELRSGPTIQCDRLLLATGSHPQGYRIAASLGHTIVPPVPSLFTFTIADTALHELAGIAVDPVTVKLSLPDTKPLQQTGPLLLTHWGFSGPAVLKLSAWGARILHQAGYRGTVQINWLPVLTPDQSRQQLQAARQEMPKRAIANACPFTVPKRLWRYWLMRAGIEADTRWAMLSKKALHALVTLMHQSRFDLQGKGAFKDEFVTCGGVALSDVNFKTMESRQCPGLFLAGEILDIDGITGGFNFQSAWTTGWLAGQAIARSAQA